VTILAVTGLKREASLIAGPNVRVVISGGAAALLPERIALGLHGKTNGIISIGIAGALSPDLKAGDCIVADRIVSGGESFQTDAEWTKQMAASLPTATCAAIAGSDVVAASQEAKADLYRTSGAYAVDMESHITARAAHLRGLPFVALRVISDRADHALPPAVQVAMKDNGGIALGRVLKSVLMQPQQIPALIRTGRESEKAFAALLRCLDLLGPGLGCPYLGLL
jgi:hopanoid-associated phosphorylase